MKGSGMSELFGTVRIEPHPVGHSVWVLAQPTRQNGIERAWVCVYSTRERNRGQWVAEAALDPEDPALGWGVGVTESVGAVPGTPADS